MFDRVKRAEDGSERKVRRAVAWVSVVTLCPPRQLTGHRVRLQSPAINYNQRYRFALDLERRRKRDRGFQKFMHPFHKIVPLSGSREMRIDTRSLILHRGCNFAATLVENFFPKRTNHFHIRVYWRMKFLAWPIINDEKTIHEDERAENSGKEFQKQKVGEKKERGNEKIETSEWKKEGEKKMGNRIVSEGWNRIEPDTQR